MERANPQNNTTLQPILAARQNELGRFYGFVGEPFRKNEATTIPIVVAQHAASLQGGSRLSYFL
jgi:hypothetical protein